MSSNFRQAAAGFNPGDFDLNKNFLYGGGYSIPSFLKFPEANSFQTGIDAGGGFAGSSGGGGFLNKLGSFLDEKNGQSPDLFQKLLNNDGTQALGIASVLGNYGTEAANRYNRGAEVAALNNQIAIEDDFRDQYNAAKLKQDLAINPEQRQKNLMGVIPELANSIAYSTGSPDSGFQSAARAARLLA